MKCSKINRGHIFFIVAAMAMQTQCSATEQIQRVVEPMRAVTELVGDLAHTVTYYSKLKTWLSENQGYVKAAAVIATVCVLGAIGVGTYIAGEAYLLEVVLPAINSVVGKFIYGTATLIPQFMMMGLQAAQRSAGSVLLYAFSNAMTTVAAAACGFAGWKLGDFVAKKFGISPTDDPKAHASMCVLGALIGLFFPFLYIYYRKQNLAKTKEKREDVEHAEKLNEIKATRIDGGVLSLTSTHYNAAYDYSKRPKVQKYVIMYIVAYVLTVACVMAGGVGTSVVWSHYEVDIRKKKKAFLLKVKEEKRSLNETWSWDNATDVQHKPIRELTPIHEEEEAEVQQEEQEEEGTISELEDAEEDGKEEKAPQLQEVHVPINEAQQNELLLGGVNDEEEDVDHDDERPKWVRHLNTSSVTKPSQQVIVSVVAQPQEEVAQLTAQTEPISPLEEAVTSNQKLLSSLRIARIELGSTTPEPLSNIIQRYQSLDIEQRFLTPSVAPSHLGYGASSEYNARVESLRQQRHGISYQGYEDDEDSKQEELPEQTPDIVRSLRDPKTGHQYTPVKFLLNCIEFREPKLAEACIKKYSSEFDVVPVFSPSFYKREGGFMYGYKPSLLGRALLAASKEGYLGLASLLIADEKLRERIPKLLDKDGKTAVQLAVMGGYEVIANRLSGQGKPSLVTDALKRRKVYLTAVLKLEETQATYSQAKVAAQTEKKEARARAEATYNEAITTAQLKRDECAEYVNTQAKAKARAELAEAMWDFETKKWSISARGEREKARAKLREIRTKYAKYIGPIGGAAIWLGIKGRAKAELKKSRAAWEKAAHGKAKAARDKTFAEFKKAQAEFKKALALAEIERAKGDKVLAKYEAQEEQEKVLAHKAESVYNQAKATAQTERKKAETQVKAAYDKANAKLEEAKTKAQTECDKAIAAYDKALAALK